MPFFHAMMIFRFRPTIACILLGLTGLACTTGSTVVQKKQPVASDPATAWVDSTLAAMSLEEKVGQVIMPGAYGHYLSTDSDEYARVVRYVQEWKVGGLIMFQGDVYEEAIAINRLQGLAKIPLLIAGDFERGLAMRVRRGTYFPDTMAVGATGKPEFAYKAAYAIAVEGRAIGVHQNYAPVADINTNPDNPVINTRSFGEDPKLVAEMTAAFTRGTNDGGMISTAKHFPGHGDAGIDSHLDLPVVYLDRKHLDSLELFTFRSAIDNGVMSMMIGHISVPALDSTPALPATLSKPIVTDLLKTQLGFNGLIVTDALEMQGLTRGFSVGESVVRSFAAGVDLLLLPPDVSLAVGALLSAVRTGVIMEQRLDSSVRKVLAIKYKLGLLQTRYTSLDKIGESVGTKEHRLLAKEIARSAITVIRNQQHVLPLSERSKGKITAIIISDPDENTTMVNRPGNPWPVEPVGGYFLQQLRRRDVPVEALHVSTASMQGELDAAIEKARKADLIALAVCVKVRSASGHINLPEPLTAWIDRLAKIGKPTIVISFGSPYVLGAFRQAQALMCAYSDAECLVEAAVEAMFGEIDVTGKLPVSIRNDYAYGSGITSSRVSLRRDDPAAAQFDNRKLFRVEEIITSAIRDSAFPCAQVVVAREGKVVLQKSFGTYTYDATSRQIDASTMFDLASLTKVIATTSAAMKLYDQNLLSLDDPVSKYIPQFGSGPKARITIRHLLTHTSGFKPFLKLYDVCKTPQEALDSIYASELVAAPGDTMIYSDLGIITLAKIEEKITGQPLDQYVRQQFYEPLNMHHTMFNPPADIWQQVAPTEVDTVWRMRLIRGQVHDERSFLLGGVAGHAGLFSTASDLAVFMQMLLNGGTYGGIRYLSEGTVKLFTQRQSATSTRALGWDTKSPTGSSAGDYFSPTSFGHTGFTGTSIWADPVRKLFVILLTNRVYPTRANLKIMKIRPAVNNAVIEALTR